MGFSLMGAGTWTKKTMDVTLATGSAWIVPSGQYIVDLGNYSVIQYWDAITGIWRNLDGPCNSFTHLVTSDGFSVRLFNPTGTAVGAYVTNGGSGYTNGIYPQGTAQTGSYVVATGSAGLANFSVVVGGAINTTVTVTTAGVGYNNPPSLIFSDPPAGGVKASGIAVVSGGAITSVTVTNQGAGYTVAPTVLITPHPADSVTTQALLTTALANSGRVTAVLLGPNGGNSYTSTPTISFAQSAGSSAAATVLMCYTVQSLASFTGGSANQTAATLFFSCPTLATAKTNAPLNPQVEQGLFTPRLGWATTTLSTGAITAAGIVDGGLHQTSTITITTAAAWATAAPTSSASATITAGGVSDTSFVTPL